MEQDTTRAKAMLAEMARQRDYLGTRAAVFAADLAEAQAKIAELEQEKAAQNGEAPAREPVRRQPLRGA